MAFVYDPVNSIFLGRENWRLKVRVMKVCDMFPIDEPSRTFSVEMVLVDQMGTRVRGDYVGDLGYYSGVGDEPYGR
ncbi:hypothetical protein SESBI_16639 [Sesbania bispinosa]|nr:hypothetical protein SESBI_16639 [Sesbania bispinosa]